MAKTMNTNIKEDMLLAGEEGHSSLNAGLNAFQKLMNKHHEAGDFEDTSAKYQEITGDIHMSNEAEIRNKEKNTPNPYLGELTKLCVDSTSEFFENLSENIQKNPQEMMRKAEALQGILPRAFGQVKADARKAAKATGAEKKEINQKAWTELKEIEATFEKAVVMAKKLIELEIEKQDQQQGPQQKQPVQQTVETPKPKKKGFWGRAGDLLKRVAGTVTSLKTIITGTQTIAKVALPVIMPVLGFGNTALQPANPGDFEGAPNKTMPKNVSMIDTGSNKNMLQSSKADLKKDNVVPYSTGLKTKSAGRTK